MEKSLKIFSDMEEAERDDREFYGSMTPQERLDYLVDLLNRWGKLNERRLERVIEIVENP